MASFTWKGGAGDWNLAGNWQAVAGTDTIPTAADDAAIAAAGNYAVTVSDAEAAGSLLLSAPGGRLDIGGALTVGSLTIDGAQAVVAVTGTLATFGGTGTVLVSQGTLAASGALLGPGTYAVAGGTAMVGGGALFGTAWQGAFTIDGLGVTTDIAGGLSLAGAGGIGPGAATIDSTTVAFTDDTTLDNATLALVQTPSSITRIVLSGTTLTLGPSLLVTASGGPGSLQFGAGGTVVNHGTLHAIAALALGGTFVNDGTVESLTGNQSTADVFVNDGVLRVENGSFFAASLAGTGTVALAGGAGRRPCWACPRSGPGRRCCAYPAISSSRPIRSTRRR